jgi:hypothetical protein
VVSGEAVTAGLLQIWPIIVNLLLGVQTAGATGRCKGRATAKDPPEPA